MAFGAAERSRFALSKETEAQINELREPASPVSMVEFRTLIAEAAQKQIRAGIPEDWALKPMDAVHLAAARRTRVEASHTYDGRLESGLP